MEDDPLREFVRVQIQPENQITFSFQPTFWVLSLFGLGNPNALHACSGR